MTSANRYQRGNLIGKGGMGSVYHGLDTQTGQSVALKFLLPELAAHNPEAVERFRREGETLRHLDHPNIVKILDFCDIDDTPCIVTEFMSSGSLADLIQLSGPLSVEQTLKIALELADALTRAHHLEIIHRDIKPDNILLAEDGTPRLTDFGLARLTQSASLTDERMIVGTLHYLSPEAINNEALDEGTDIWAFGVTLFKMLTGIQPFRGETVGAICQSILRNTPDPDLELLRPDIPLALTDLVYRMLEKDRRLRIPSVRLVGAELWGILRGVDLNLYSQKAVVEEETFSFLRSEPVAKRPKHNLPKQSTPFIGREDDIEAIISLFDDPNVRLVSIVGQGGMGKTRLSLQVAESMLDAVENGVYFVPFAGIDTPEFMVSAMMDALGLQGIGLQASDGRPEASPLFKYLREKDILLVLDNLEQLLDGVGLLSELLQAAPQLKILATSREKLNLRGEKVYWLEGLDAPSDSQKGFEDYSAVQLFLDRVQLIQPDIEPSSEDERAIAQICQLVDGMPLGIELAASWLDMLSPQEIAAEITKSLDFLESDLRDLPDRHRSMRALFESTWQHLSSDEQNVMMRLSVFRGGFTQHAATAVTGTTLRMLRRLTNKSLLRRNELGRYDIHELLRQFAAERLASDSDTEIDAHEQHSQYFLDNVAAHESFIKGSRQREAIENLQINFENIRVAWKWGIDHNDKERLQNVLYCFARFLEMVGDPSARERILRYSVDQLQKNKPDQDSIILGACMTWLALFMQQRGENAKILFQRGESMLRRLNARRELATALCAVIYFDGFDAISQITESISIFKELDDQYGIASSYLARGYIVSEDADLQFQRHSLEESLRLFRQLGCKRQIATCLWRLGILYTAEERNHEGRELFRESLHDFRALGFTVGSALVLSQLGLIEAKQGHYQESLALLGESLNIRRELGHLRFVAAVSDTIGLVHHMFEEYDQAKQWFDESLVIHTDLHQYDRVAFQNAQLGFVELALSNIEQSKAYFRTALSLLAKFHHYVALINIIIGIAMIAARSGNMKRALELIYFTAQRPAVDKHVQDEQRLLAELEAELPPDAIAATKKRADELTLDEVIEILWEELGTGE